MSDNQRAGERIAFDFSGAAVAVPADLAELFHSTWSDLASPGNGWTADEKRSIVDSVRRSRATGESPTDLPRGETTNRLVDRLVHDPAGSNREWVRKSIEELGVVRYVEAVGWGAIVLAVDTFHQLVSLTLPEFPEPIDGDPLPVGDVPGLRMRKAWVPMTGLPLPRMSTSAVPRTQEAANRILDRMYMLPGQSREVSRIRGLAPAQLELVVSVVSHSNRCFYCTLGHIHSMLAAADHAGLTIDTRGIVDSSIDLNIPGSRELIELSRSASTPDPDPATLKATVDVLGPAGAVTAAEVAACFQMVNRLVEMTGQPAMANQRERMMPVIEPLGLLEFPHSGLTITREKPSLAKRVVRKLRG